MGINDIKLKYEVIVFHNDYVSKHATRKHCYCESIGEAEYFFYNECEAAKYWFNGEFEEWLGNTETELKCILESNDDLFEITLRDFD